MAYSLHLDKRIEKDLNSLPVDIQKRMLNALVRLQNDPKAVSSKKLVGEESYQIRIGDYRVVYEIDTVKQEITVLKVAHRKDVYRR